MTILIPRRVPACSVRVYPVVDDKYATADDLVAVFMDRWGLLGAHGAPSRLECASYPWLRATAAQLWTGLRDAEIDLAVDWLTGFLIDELPRMGGAERAAEVALLRRLEILLGRAFGFTPADRASRAATVATAADQMARLIEVPQGAHLPARAWGPARSGMAGVPCGACGPLSA